MTAKMRVGSKRLRRRNNVAWNPSPEVAVVRDAANKLGTPFAVIIYLHESGPLAMATYGKTRALCDQTGELGKHLLDAAEEWTRVH